MTTTARVLLAVLVCLVAAPAVAEDGAIPIWEPTTITQPGHYVLVRNIDASASTFVLTVAADDVDLDLNGFTINGRGIYAAGVRGLAVHDGFLHSAGDTVLWTDLENFSLRRVVSVTDYGELAVQINDSRHGVVEDNTIRIGGDDALWVTGSSFVIRGNRFDADVQIYAAGSEVSGNLLENGELVVARSGNSVHDNVVTGAGGRIRVCEFASDNLVARNTVSAVFGTGIDVRGSHNHVVDNVLNGNGGFGLLFSESSVGNVFRGNTARANGGTGCPTANADFCDYGTDNTSHGDNYMPGRL